MLSLSHKNINNYNNKEVTRFISTYSAAKYVYKNSRSIKHPSIWYPWLQLLIKSIYNVHTDQMLPQYPYYISKAKNLVQSVKLNICTTNTHINKLIWLTTEVNTSALIHWNMPLITNLIMHKNMLLQDVAQLIHIGRIVFFSRKEKFS